MPDWRLLVGLINFGTVYYTAQLVRCVAFSFVLIGIVMLFRKTLFSEWTFLKGMLWADRIYMANIMVAANCIFGKRLRLCRSASRMEKVMFENVHIYVTDMNITPFTVGLLKPKIVLPKGWRTVIA